MRSHYRPAGVQLLSGLGWSALQEINRASDCLKAMAPWNTHLTLTTAASTRKRRLFYFLATCRDQCSIRRHFEGLNPKCYYFFLISTAVSGFMIPVCAHSKECVSKNSLPDGSLNVDGAGSCAKDRCFRLVTKQVIYLNIYLTEVDWTAMGHLSWLFTKPNQVDQHWCDGL